MSENQELKVGEPAGCSAAVATRTQTLYASIDETDHQYTWDYTTRRRAFLLFDVDSERFAMIAFEEDIADETGAMGDYRHSSNYVGSLYSKSALAPIQAVEAQTLDQLMARIKNEPWGSQMEKVESIRIAAGVVSISDGSLMLTKN
jgi:hypothetical protein